MCIFPQLTTQVKDRLKVSKEKTMLKMDETQRAGIINAISKVANQKVAPVIVEILEASDTLESVTAETLIEKGVSKTASESVVAAIELHTTLASVSTRKAREKKPSVAETFKANKSADDIARLARQVAEKRINAEGTKPTAWRKIRESLGLKNDEFHGVIRKSEIWRDAVLARISSLKAQEGGWEYSGKLEVLTGIYITEKEISGYVSSVEQGLLEGAATVPSSENSAI